MTGRPAPSRSFLHPARVAAVIVLVGCVAGGAYLVFGAEATSPARLAGDVQGMVDGLPGIAAWLVVALVAIACLVCLTPSPIVIGACGLLLGAWAGFAAGIVAIGVAVVLERLLAATIAGRVLHARLVRTRPDVDARIARWGLPGIVLVRALGAPTTVIAWASSATALRPVHVSVGCMLGSMPRGLAYATLGSAGASLLRPGDWTRHVWASVAMLVALLGVSVTLAWRQTQR